MLILLLLAAVAHGQAPQRYLPPPAVEEIRLRPAHPRLIFRPPAGPGPGRTFEDVRQLNREDAVFRAIFAQALVTDPAGQGPALSAVLWIVTGEDRHARAAADLLLEAAITHSGGGRYSNVWSFALAYDWLHDHPSLAGGAREKAAARIAGRLESELAQLDASGMATWHGRNQAANNAMVAALAVGDLPGQANNLRRAAAHYADALRALDFSEGWPEGPSYWIYNRAAPYAVAADSFLTATGAESLGGVAIREVMRKIGLWSLYSYAPNGVFEPFGDSAGSLRLGETGWWEVAQDYFAKLSRDPAVAAGADYFRNRSPSPYGRRPLHWYAALAYDPSARPAAGYDPARPEEWMRSHLPRAMLFGRDSLGVAFFRGAWGDADELFAAFKAGDLLAHHDHYQAGHFSIQRGGLLAPLTGLYGPGGYTGAYRLGYAVQTVASNSLLILAPGESSANLRSLKDSPWTALSGGQRVIRPTGFDCLSLDHFRDQLNAGPHLERAAITAFEIAPGGFDYAAADLTAAYNSTRFAEAGAAAKVSLVTRQFVHLREEEAFVVYDRVETTAPGYLPKFLLHSLAKPAGGEERLLAGNDENDGILESRACAFTVSHQRGVLTHRVLLPEQARALKIGGPNFYAYVEADGDQGNGFDGVNLNGGDPAAPHPGKQLGLWRLELEPLAAGTSHRFLNVLLPRLASDAAELPEVELLEAGEDAHAVRVGGTVLVFARQAAPLARVAVQWNGRLRAVILDARPDAGYDVDGRRIQASGEGVLEAGAAEGGFRAAQTSPPPGPAAARVSW